MPARANVWDEAVTFKKAAWGWMEKSGKSLTQQVNLVEKNWPIYLIKKKKSRRIYWGSLRRVKNAELEERAESSTQGVGDGKVAEPRPEVGNNSVSVCPSVF